MCQPPFVLKKVLVVEDDCDLRESIIMYLQHHEVEVIGVGTAIDFYNEVKKGSYGLAILDISLPDQDGLVLARYLRANTRMRIIMLTARVALEDRLLGYESGADLYLSKPVDFRELLVSVQNLLTRFNDSHQGELTVETPPSELEADTWVLHRNSWELVLPDGATVQLTGKELEFLILLAGRHSGLVSRDRILQSLGYAKQESSHRALESLVYRLRKKISPTLETPIKTASGSGYSFSSHLLVLNT
ncbi:MAG: transcriptional regulator [Pelodictyon luteolum]|jgi:DNA-binding response OmpR family regulator|uniref:Transcriptional regulator n=1 Tax=Pelodictyon luteolum TaxID=1100 RepID=A0A165LPG2_PELLU|nr:MAG: transcriptional regulator [Pelodictyon luteolum]